MLSYSFANENDREKLKSLWLSSFEDKEEAVSLFLNDYKYKALVCKDEEKIVSALYLLSCKLDDKDIYYIYAASTDINYRKQGIMGKLLYMAEDVAKKNGIYAIALLPQNESLVSFYEKYGYKQFFKARSFSLERRETHSFNEENSDIACIRNEKLPKNSIVWEKNHFDYIDRFYRFYNGAVVKAKNSYAIVSYCNDKICEITEFFADEICFDKLFSKICEKFNSETYVFTTSENMFKNKGDVNYKGMIKFICENKENLNGGYLGAALE